MASKIFHLGTSIPSSILNKFDIMHTEVIQISYQSSMQPEDINEFLKHNPIILILSKSGIYGFKKWLNRFNINENRFKEYSFWTVGEKTYECLMEELSISSQYPKKMTGIAAITNINQLYNRNILLVCGSSIRSDLKSSIIASKMNYYHFPVYKTELIKNKIFQSSFQNNRNEYIIFTSPSTVDGLIYNLSCDNLELIKSNLISIGSTTSQYIKDKQGKIFYESTYPSIINLYDQLNDLI